MIFKIKSHEINLVKSLKHRNVLINMQSLIIVFVSMLIGNYNLKKNNTKKNFTNAF